MDNVKVKLTKCFGLVFPKLDPRQIPSASAGNVAEWDSVAQVQLLSLIGEELAIDVDFEEFEDATSFETLLDRLGQIGASA